MAYDFDDHANTPSGAELPEGAPSGTSAPPPDGLVSDDAEVPTVQQQLSVAVESLLAVSAVAQRKLSAAIEPLLAAAAVWQDRYGQLFGQIAAALASKLPEIGRWIEDFHSLIPANLHGIQSIDVVFSVALEEGIPLSWIPNAATVAALVEADGPQERVRILTERRDDILDDCDAALAPMSHEWATECRDAIRALREGLSGSAQSHASNIIDSIVPTLAGNGVRYAAVDLAQRDIDDVSFRAITEMLTLRPLARAFTPWWPHAGTPLPAHFSRHATSHAVGHTGVFKPEYALTAIMLATSLIVQFESNAPQPEALAHRAPTDSAGLAKIVGTPVAANN